MESISSDSFTSIVSYLPNKSIAALITNANLDKAIKELVSDNIFWKQRVETLLERCFDDVYPNWKFVHNKLILDFKGKVNLKKFGSKALLRASEEGHHEIVKLLLEDDRVNLSMEDGSYAIELASQNGYLEAVKLLLIDDRVNPSAHNNQAIISASKKGYTEIVKLLLTNDSVDPSAQNDLAIQTASTQGYLEIAKLLLSDNRVNPSDKNNEAIIRASENDNLEVVKLLLADNRVSPSEQNNLAIKSASKFGYSEIVKLFLADRRISIETKIDSILALDTTESYLLQPVFDINRIKDLAELSLSDLIKRGNNSEYDRELHKV